MLTEIRDRVLLILLALATCLALSPPSQAAVDANPSDRHPASATQADQPNGSITVSAAASLMDVLPVIASAYQKRYPGTSIRFNFGGSSTLVNQAIAGAPVDVLATASESTLWKAVEAGVANRPWIFARNRMAIAMPADNPARITSLADLARPGVLVGVCDVAVPCGAAARDLLDLNSIAITPVTRELDVRALLAKVVSGDLDAGIVYVTDVRAVGAQATSVAIPSDRNVTTTYPIATVGQTSNPVLAQSFVNYVRFSRSAQGILRAYGFERPW